MAARRLYAVLCAAVIIAGCADPRPVAEVPIVVATPTASGPTASLNVGPQPEASPWPAQLTESQVREVLRLAGWPDGLAEEALMVTWCESRWSPGAVGDSGQSLGLFQLWTGWFPALGLPVEHWADPVVNATAALRVLERRGGWGGGGGWSCAP